MKVRTYYLEMNTPEELIEKTDPRGLAIVEAKINEFRFNKFLYQLIGEQWAWVDKLSLPEAEWEAYVENPDLRTWVAYYEGTIAGYFELNTNESGDTEIAYFGLAPNFIGKGFGGYLLSQAISNAWKITKTKRVWVHTCSLDHDSALSNYKARGLKLYKQEIA
ncbi:MULTISPECIES: GNAT family N-acetyltransferase [Colwellia]|uniref:N-acetyltransferase n=1 Tax=Colwellia marinimaniae TaxID=1513592 RepID=A0ABQ0MY85_9GAMM|nr:MULTISPECIES: GNAT family N-acetyltransferase [Colwellia]GAW97207.1 N-acetyltransferase [Colwellia marinimaniae]